MKAIGQFGYFAKQEFSMHHVASNANIAVLCDRTWIHESRNSSSPHALFTLCLHVFMPHTYGHTLVHTELIVTEILTMVGGGTSWHRFFKIL